MKWKEIGISFSEHKCAFRRLERNCMLGVHNDVAKDGCNWTPLVNESWHVEIRRFISYIKSKHCKRNEAPRMPSLFRWLHSSWYKRAWWGQKNTQGEVVTPRLPINWICHLSVLTLMRSFARSSELGQQEYKTQETCSNNPPHTFTRILDKQYTHWTLINYKFGKGPYN